MITVTYLSPRLVWRQLGRPGARCSDCSEPVSPDRPPNPACDSHRTGLSTRWLLFRRLDLSVSTASGCGSHGSGTERQGRWLRP